MNQVRVMKKLKGIIHTMWTFNIKKMSKYPKKMRSAQIMQPSKENKALQVQDTRLDIDKNQVQLANNDVEDKIEEEIIPIWGEQIIIDKKMVKLGEIVIRKSKTTEKRKLDVVVRKDKVTAE